MNKVTQKLSQKEDIRKCFDCGAELILVEETTMVLGNNLYPITKTTFRCSNNICQEAADERAAKKIELKKEQEIARVKRAEANIKFELDKISP